MSVVYLWSNLSDVSRGENSTNKAGAAVAWTARATGTEQANNPVTATVATVAGPTNGLEFGNPVTEWISPPLAEQVVISGTMTIQLFGLESNAMANATLGIRIERLTNTLEFGSLIYDGVYPFEIITSAIQYQFTATPTSTTMPKGSRFRFRIYADDGGGTMASGYTVSFNYGGASSGPFSSNIDFAETLTFMSPSDARNYFRENKLTASDNAANNNYGQSVACSADMSIIAVGGYTNVGSNTNGKVYVYSGSNYQTELILTASDGAAFDFFGGSLAMTPDGSKLFVSASNADVSGVSDAGAVYVRSGTNYATSQKLTATDLTESVVFGSSLACSSDGATVVVGAQSALSGGVTTGAVYVFTGSNYATQYKLTASDAAASDLLGSSVACSSDGSIIVAGAPFGDPSGLNAAGYVAVFVWNAGQNQYVYAHKLTSPAISSFENFGRSVACSADGSKIVVGGTGSVYVFSGTNYTTTQTLTYPVNDLARIKCSSDASVIFYGCYSTGNALVQIRSGANYATLETISGSDSTTTSEYGRELACSATGASVVVTANKQTVSGLTNAGAAYVHNRTPLYLTNVASSVADQGASVTELTAWTARGTG